LDDIFEYYPYNNIEMKMKAMAYLKNLKCEEEKKTILRNLGRILDIRIIYIDLNNGILFFLYANPMAFEKVKQELLRIGYPIKFCKNQNPSPSEMQGSGRPPEIVAE
jgi:hypothetical protein